MICLLALLTACAPAAAFLGSGDQAATSPRPSKSDAKGDDDDDDDDRTEPAGPAAGGTTPADESFPPVDTSELDPFFTAQMQKANIPGVSVAVVRGAELKWAKGYGLANIEQRKAVAKDTVFLLASVSKTVAATALMQLIEDPSRGLALDQDINEKVGFSVRHPSFRTVPITYRMLLTHTSSLIESEAFGAGSAPVTQGDSPMSLVSFVKSSIAQPDGWLDSARPGTTYDYSNTGVAIVGLLVETISGMNLQDYCKKNIFGRLGMTETSWFLRGLDQSHIAMPYDGTGLTPQGHYGYPDYQAGQIRTSARQLSRFLRMFVQNGELGGERILRASTVADMQRAQVPSIEPGQGLIWYADTERGGAIGHNGGDKGVSTEMYFNPQTKAGYVLLTNGSETMSEAANSAAMQAMGTRLMQLAKTLP